MGGGQRNIGMEGFLVKYYNARDDTVETHWLGYLSDEKQQDARTSFCNTRLFIREAIKGGVLAKGSTLWVQSDGCSEQDKSGTTGTSWTHDHCTLPGLTV